jgi:pyocin large subunit-like protein
MTAYRGLPWRRLLAAALGAVAIFLYWSHTSERAAHDAARRPSVELTQSQDRRWGTAVGFASERRLDEHYEKHSREFGRLTKQDYLQQAQALRDAPAGGPILESVRGDGVVTRYDRETGAFIAYNPDGVIRTYFKPNDGERYFRRQAERFE